jgi:hypothetical protein
MKIIQNVKVNFDSAHHCVVIDLDFFANSEQIKIAGLAALDLLGSHACKVVVVNQSKNPNPDFERREWVADIWFEKAVALGMEKLALVVADDYFKKIEPKQFKNGSFSIAFFNKIEDAFKWSRLV